MQEEDSLAFLIYLATIDTSPYTGGRPCALLSAKLSGRYIPPCRGKTLFGLDSLPKNRIHPPIQEEDTEISPARNAQRDTSSYTGGRRIPANAVELSSRYIPPIQEEDYPGAPLHMQERDTSPYTGGRLYHSS